MRTTTLAVALALALTGLGGVISVSPQVQAQSNNCPTPADFPIPSVEPPDALARELDAGESEIGQVTLLAGIDQMLNVELVDADADNSGTSGTLHYEVFTEPNCQAYDEGAECEGTLREADEGDTQTCLLTAPAMEDRTYWVVFEETSNASPIEYKTWAN